jgi:hypothetical protein
MAFTMTRYKEMYNQMVVDNKEKFDAFRSLHDNYALEPEKWQDEYNEKGKEVMTIIRHYEDVLCGRSEGTGYGAFSGKLAEKFQEEVRKNFPKIDHIGVKIKNPGFQVKKINL